MAENKQGLWAAKIALIKAGHTGKCVETCVCVTPEPAPRDERPVWVQNLAQNAKVFSPR